MSCAFKVVQIVHGSKVYQVCYLACLQDFVDLGSQLVGYGVQGVAGSNPAVPIRINGRLVRTCAARRFARQGDVSWFARPSPLFDSSQLPSRGTAATST
jgi:hypothetical protein